MEKQNLLTNMDFYTDIDTFSWLLDYANAQDDADLVLSEGDHFRFHLCEEPIYAALSKAGGSTRVRIYFRSETGITEDLPELGCVFPSGSRTGTVDIDSQRTDGDAIRALTQYMEVGQALRLYIIRHGLMTEFADLDPEKEGILVFLEDEEPEFQRVSGEARPDLACMTALGDVQMMRPYGDEILAYQRKAALSPEEKIRLAEGGDTEMMEYLASAYLTGEGADRDPAKAAGWFRKLAELGRAEDQCCMGLLHIRGLGVERDFEKAVFWLQKAADGGDNTAPDLIPDCRTCLEKAEKAKAGDAQAQAELAMALTRLSQVLTPEGGEEDLTAALHLAEQSAAQNSGLGLWVLALACEHGRGTPKDEKKAMELYRKGAELGDPACQHSLGCYYLEGDVIPKDTRAGFAWCMKAAQQGYPRAMKMVGSCCQFGIGTEKDLQEALKWYEKGQEAEPEDELGYKIGALKMAVGQS